VLYHLRARGIECDLIPCCEREGIAVVGYSPFSGLPRPGSREWRVLEEVGARHGKTPRQVTLRFLIHAPGVFAIPKAADPDHVRENAGAGGFVLSADDIAVIDRMFPAPHHQVPLQTA